MKLKTWLKRNKVSCKDFAKLLGLEISTVYKYRDGTRIPSLPVALKIEKTTRGHVKVSVWGK